MGSMGLVVVDEYVLRFPKGTSGKVVCWKQDFGIEWGGDTQTVQKR